MRINQYLDSGTILIDDLGLGEITFSRFGDSVSFEVLSMFDGHTLGHIVCKQITMLKIDRGNAIAPNVAHPDEYEIFGSCIALTTIKAGSVTMESGDIFIQVDCVAVEPRLMGLFDSLSE